MSTTSRRWRRLAVAVASLALAVGALPATTAAAAPSTTGKAPVDKKVSDQIARKGYASFWVVLDSDADLSGAARLKGKTEKARHVRTTKIKHAERTQAGLIGLLKRAHADYTSYWIDNSLYVTGDADLLATIAARPEVAAVEADEPVAVPEPAKGTEEAQVDGVEWNIDRINASQVWSGLGVRGEGIVVANIDTGVDYTHPAVANQYRGKRADGTYDHNYNWFDPAGICPAGTPCDNNDHGTHTMGTMVGDDGSGNQIGVAPGATWIAAKGCESGSCTRTSLLASGQWIVAPTDLNGQNPRPDLAPDVVNNSWGSSAFDTWYADTVQAWISAGIFPAFSNGNSGPSCNTSGTPGEYVISYSSGAFDINNQIASFSSRGPGENGDIKPNIASPGVNVRSSVPGGYASYSGTSMASPHTAAAVALMWSASPAIQGDIAATREILDQTALDVNDTTCGGTAADNHVWGEGKLDAYAAVLATPRGALGALAGTVTSGGEALAGATVAVTGPMSRTTTTAADGTYSFGRLMVGDYQVRVSKFGYLTATTSATVAEGETTVGDVTVEQAPSGTLSGTVRLSSGAVAAGATVKVLNTPVSGVADEAGHYRLTLPYGDYQIEATHANRCASSATETVSVTGDTVHDVTLPERRDGFGYGCGSLGGEYVPGTDLVAGLSGDDKVVPVTMPFKVPLYGKGYKDAYISTNGWLAFNATTSSLPGNRSIPYTGTPNAALYAFWDDLYVDASAGVYTAVTGEAPNRAFVVEWRNVAFYADRNTRISFTATISESGEIGYRYANIDNDRDAGGYATIGIENAAGTVGFEYSYDEPVVASGDGLRFTTDAGVAHGMVTDANDQLPVPGATVTARSGDTVVDTTTTGQDGDYLLQLPAGDYQVTVSKDHYEAVTDTVSLRRSTVVGHATVLRTARVESSADDLTVVTPPGEQRDRNVTLTNTGVLGTDFTVVEADASGAEVDVPWLSVTGGSGSLGSGGNARLQVTVDASALEASSYQRAQLLVKSASGRTPVLPVPVTVVAPGYQVALDAGGLGGVVDSFGDTWSTDQEYTEGSCGWVGSSHAISTTKGISGTEDDARFQDLREGMTEYRFDGLADGVYTVELDFAELRSQKPNSRLFDVHLEGGEVLRRFDVAAEGGSYGAVSRTFTVRVTDGQLNVQFYTYRGFGLPIVNAIRVTDRPDLTV